MGEEIGTIADLVLDLDQKLALSVGGFLGIGEKWVVFDQIDFPTDEQRRACWSRSPRSSSRTRPTS